MNEIQMGEAVLLPAKVVYLPDRSRSVENQAVSVQLRDGQGVQTNVRNLQRTDAEAIAQAKAEEEAAAQETINALLQEQEGQHQARLVQFEQAHQVEVTALEAKIEALQADRDEAKATAEAFADRIRLLEAQIEAMNTKALAPTEAEPEKTDPTPEPKPTRKK